MSARGFAAILVDHHLLTDKQAEEAQAQAEALNVPLLRYVVEHELLDASTAAYAAAVEYGLPLIDLEAVAIDTLPPASQFPGSLLKALSVLPLSQRDHQLTVAIGCPSQLAKLQEVRYRCCPN